MSCLTRRLPIIRFPLRADTADGDDRRTSGIPRDDILAKQRSSDLGKILRKPTSETQNPVEGNELEEKLNLLEQKGVKFNSCQPSPLLVEDKKEENGCDNEPNRSNRNGRCKNGNTTANSNQSSSKVNKTSSTSAARDIDDDVFNAFLRRFRDMAPSKDIEISIVSGQSIAEEDEEAEEEKAKLNEQKPTVDLPVTRLTVCTKTNEERDREVRYTKVSVLMVIMFLLCHIPRLVTNAGEMLIKANCKTDNCIPTWYLSLIHI